MKTFISDCGAISKPQTASVKTLQWKMKFRLSSQRHLSTGAGVKVVTPKLKSSLISDDCDLLTENKLSCTEQKWRPLFFSTSSVYWQHRLKVMLGLRFPSPDSVLMPSRGSVTPSGDEQLASGSSLDCLGWESSVAGPTQSLHWKAFIPKHHKSI